MNTQYFLLSLTLGGLPVLPALAGEPGDVAVKGEIVDLVCYTDHGAAGAEHADCAKACIGMGLPVGLKGEDGKTYLLVGDHKPLNEDAAQYAAKTVTVKGKVVSRDGINMIENAEISK
jgi:hypothetical protein